MFNEVKRFGQIVSLTVMLLLVAALVASQANARSPDQARPGPAVEQAQELDKANTPLKTTIRARIIGQPITISVDPVSGFGNIRFIVK